MRPLTGKGKDLIAFVCLNVLLAVSGWIATSGFKRSQVLVDVSQDPTPLGYLKSLVLFALPCVLFGIWLGNYLASPTRRRALWLTVFLLAPLGLVLDVFFGRSFFVFRNVGATVAGYSRFWLLPAFSFETGTFQPYIPVEEVLFYFMGFLSILLTYIWSDQVVFGAHKVSHSQKPPKALASGPRALLFWGFLGAALSVISWLIRRAIPPEQGAGAFPGYFIFLVWTAVVPSMVCSRLAFHFVNFRALTLAWLFVLGISQFWEAALAIPYQWWGYQPDRMIGLRIRAQCDLPVEAVLVWTLGTWAAVMVYETVLNVLRIKVAQPDRAIHEALRGEERDVDLLKRYYP